jgi:hypothetical protein
MYMNDLTNFLIMNYLWLYQNTYLWNANRSFIPLFTLDWLLELKQAPRLWLGVQPFYIHEGY